jgi:DNA ligase-1
VIAYDILEFNGKDIRFYPLKERKLILSELCKSKTISLLKISEEYTFKNWDEVVTFKSTCKRNHCEGLMFKKIDEIYVSGKRVNSWIKWKFQPYTLDAILLYAQKGRGKRSGLYTDYSFGLWNNNELVPFAKAYSGLSNKEIHELNQWIKQNTLEKFGTVRLVKPQHVFEIAFEGINISKRHKSGFAVRFPRILRWRKDKLVHEANHIEDLKKLIENQF